MQIILDAVYNHSTEKYKDIDYYGKNKHIKVNLVISYLKETNELLIQIEDITKEAQLELKRHDSSVFFILAVSGLCVWIFLYAIWDQLGRNVSFALMSDGLVALSFIIFLIYYHNTSLTLEDIGISKKHLFKYCAIDTLIGIGGFLLLMLIKYLMIKMGYYPSDSKVVDFSLFSFNEVIYIVMVFLQELIARGLAYGGMERLIDGKHSKGLAIIVSSLFFGALHVHGGLIYMFGAGIMLGLLGLVYIRQKNIWGLCIAHYILGIGLVLIAF